MWIVKYSSKAAKQAEKLPQRVKEALNTLVNEIKMLGPVRGNWPNYGKLDDGIHHCHLKKGHPTFVVVWQEVTGNIQMVRITYAGTHEKAPY